MKLHFEPNLDYQHTAIEAVYDLFHGQEICRTEFTVTRDATAAQQSLAFAQSELGIGNRLQLLDDEILGNLGDIQIRHGQHVPTRPIHDRHQVKEAAAHRDVGDVGAPDLIGPVDRHALEQIGVDLLLRMRIAGAWRSLKYEAVYLHELTDGFEARRLIDEWIGFYNTARPHSALDGKTPLEAYRGDPPVDMMDKPLRALPTSPQAQQQRQEDLSKEILAV